MNGVHTEKKQEERHPTNGIIKISEVFFLSASNNF